MLESVWERFGGETVIDSHLGLYKDIPFDSTMAFVEHVLSTKTTNRGLFVMVDAGTARPGRTHRPLDLAQVDRLYGLIQAYA